MDEYFWIVLIDGHFWMDVHRPSFYGGRSWMVILDRMIMNGHFWQDGHGRSLW